jgi:hypothetical protein
MKNKRRKKRKRILNQRNQSLRVNPRNLLPKRLLLRVRKRRIVV